MTWTFKNFYLSILSVEFSNFAEEKLESHMWQLVQDYSVDA